jgi:hypothetical protein
MCLAGTEFISAMSKNQFDVIKILATNLLGCILENYLM